MGSKFLKYSQAYISKACPELGTAQPQLVLPLQPKTIGFDTIEINLVMACLGQKKTGLI